MKMTYSIKSDFFTDAGLYRSRNQDSVLSCIGNPVSVFCVADGMGGHMKGELAAQIITEGIQEWFSSFYEEKYACDFFKIVDDLEECLLSINNRIFTLYNREQICGSTVVVFLVYKIQYAVFSVGDSRIYRKRGFSFEQLTRDDTWQNTDVVKAMVPEEQQKNHPNYGKLVRAVGVSKNLVISRTTEKLKQGDTFLLCSDGIYRYCTEKELRRCCAKIVGNKQNTMAKRLDRIRRRVEENGALDNLTAVLVRIGR